MTYDEFLDCWWTSCLKYVSFRQINALSISWALDAIPSWKWHLLINARNFWIWNNTVLYIQPRLVQRFHWIFGLIAAPKTPHERLGWYLSHRSMGACYIITWLRYRNMQVPSFNTRWGLSSTSGTTSSIVFRTQEAPQQNWWRSETSWSSIWVSTTVWFDVIEFAKIRTEGGILTSESVECLVTVSAEAWVGKSFCSTHLPDQCHCQHNRWCSH